GAPPRAAPGHHLQFEPGGQAGRGAAVAARVRCRVRATGAPGRHGPCGGTTRGGAVRNSLTLCTPYRAAFDRAFAGRGPDDVLAVRPALLGEAAGPPPVPPAQARHGPRILLLTARAHRPDPELIEQRCAEFRQVRG